MKNLHEEFRTKFKNGDAIKSLKLLASSMTKEEFISFSNVALKSAYDKNRFGAVEYMLSFFERNKPLLLMKIHLQTMLSNEQKMISGKKMLFILSKNFDFDVSAKIVDDFFSVRGDGFLNKYEDRKRTLLAMLLATKMENVSPSKSRIKI